MLVRASTLYSYLTDIDKKQKAITHSMMQILYPLRIYEIKKRNGK